MPTLTLRQGQRKPLIQTIAKPDLSRLILAATALVVAAVLLIWILILWFWPLRRPGGVYSFTIRSGGAAGPFLPYLANDAQRVGKTVDKSSEVAYDRLEPALRSLLNRLGDQPIVIYLAAPGVAEGTRAYWLPPAEGSLAVVAQGDWKETLISPEEIFTIFRESKSKRKLLILDSAQVGSDRNLGVFANGFMNRLADLADNQKDIGILCSCAPGQLSWTSETDHRSVFAHFVAQGIAGDAAAWDPSGRITVQGLGKYVRAQVSRWVWANRQARQTPLLVGDPRLNFVLPKVVLPAIAAKASDDKLLADLQAGWRERDRLEGLRPYRHAPLLWRQYQDALLHAERLVRDGRAEDALKSLADAKDLGQRVEARASALPMKRVWSLALADATGAGHASSARERELDNARKAIRAALVELTQESKPEAAPPAAGPTAADAAPPADALVKKDDATKKVEPAKAEDAATKKAEAGKADSKATLPWDDPELAGLFDPADRERPAFLEGQLLVSAFAFTNLNGQPDFFRDFRGEAFRRAVVVRQAAEKAAAADERIRRWIAPLVEKGDEVRRKAQDHLFANDQAQFDSGTLIEDATHSYDQATEDALAYTKAVDLVQRIEAELPYLGNWASRRGSLPDSAWEKLLADAASLADRLNGPAPAAKSDDRSVRMNALRDETSQAENAYLQIYNGFQRTYARLAKPDVAGSWREIDNALAVPMIPAATRRLLVDRARQISPSLDAEPVEGESSPTADPKADPVAKGDEIDPVFWNEALGQARLEWGLLRIGGVQGDDLESLKVDYESAKTALDDSDPTRAFAAFDRFSEHLRSLRTRLTEPMQGSSNRWIGQPDDQVDRALTGSDRVARVMPIVDLISLTEDPTDALDRFRRFSMLEWHGRRLVQDFALKHALDVFQDASEGWIESKDIRESNELARSMMNTKVTINAEYPKGVRIGAGDVTVKVTVAAKSGLPPGEAVVLIGGEAAKFLAVSVAPPKTGAQAAATTEGDLVAVPREQPAVREVLLARNDFQPGSREIRVRPMLFYRGKVFRFPSSQVLPIESVPEQVSIQIKQQVIKKGYKDQFTIHPGRGYLHNHLPLDYTLAVVNNTNRPMSLMMDYGMDKDPPLHIPVQLGPSETKDLASGTVDPLTFPPDKPDVKAERILTVTVKDQDKDGKVVSTRQYPFRKIDPKDYIWAREGVNLSDNFFWVDVSNFDRWVSAPATVKIKVKPAAFLDALEPSPRRADRSTADIPPGWMCRFAFRVLIDPKTGLPPSEIEWWLDVEGDPSVITSKTVNLLPPPKPVEPAKAETPPMP